MSHESQSHKQGEFAREHVVGRGNNRVTAVQILSYPSLDVVQFNIVVHFLTCH